MVYKTCLIFDKVTYEKIYRYEIGKMLGNLNGPSRLQIYGELIYRSYSTKFDSNCNKYILIWAIRNTLYH